MTAPPDIVAGRYRRERLVGSGGMGTVWEAWDELLDRRVALKQLHSPLGLSPEESELANQRAMREARITARLSHRYAVPVFDVVEHEGRPCIVMPFIPAVTLTAVLREAGPLDPHEAAGVGAQIAAALAAAHAVGIVHRDVKPGNILVADDGAALISDFGISHALGDVTLTSTGMVHGTPAYLSPEVARGGEATAASDVFSLGSTLYAAVEGSPPFGTGSNSIGLLHRVAAADFPPPEQAGPLAPLLAEMLSADPADRPPMGAVASRLKGLSGDAALGRKPGAVPASAPSSTEGSGVTAAVTPASAPSSTAGSGGTAAVITAGTQPDLSSAASGRRPRRRPARGLAAVAALVIAGILAGILWVQYGAPGGAVARDGNLDNRQPGPSATGATGNGSAPPSTPGGTSPTPPAPGASGSASSTRSVTTRPTTTRPTTTRPTTTPRPTPRATTSSRPPRTTTSPPATRPPGSSSAGGPAGAVRSYYALMPSGTAAGWGRMTGRYQAVQARSRATYERFWGQFQRVEVSNVSSEGPNRAVATLTYYRKNGQVEVELTAFRFVEEGGQLKIDRSWLISRGAG